MNKETGKVVEEVLDNDSKARESDLRLIYRVLEKMTNAKLCTPIGQVFEEMEKQGISFESITRKRRSWLAKHPDIKSELKATPVRQREEENYIAEYLQKGW